MVCLRCVFVFLSFFPFFFPPIFFSGHSVCLPFPASFCLSSHLCLCPCLSSFMSPPSPTQFLSLSHTHTHYPSLLSSLSTLRFESFILFLDPSFLSSYVSSNSFTTGTLLISLFASSSPQSMATIIAQSMSLPIYVSLCLQGFISIHLLTISMRIEDS